MNKVGLILKSKEIDSFFENSEEKLFINEKECLSRLKNDLWNNYSYSDNVRTYGYFFTQKDIDKVEQKAFESVTSVINQIKSDIKKRIKPKRTRIRLLLLEGEVSNFQPEDEMENNRHQIIKDFIKDSFLGDRYFSVIKELLPQTKGNLIRLGCLSAPNSRSKSTIIILPLEYSPEKTKLEYTKYVINEINKQVYMLSVDQPGLKLFEIDASRIIQRND